MNPVDPSRYRDTAAQAAAHALPRQLGAACEVLKLAHQKDNAGALLIRRHCKPRKPTKDNPAEWNESAEGLADLTAYCARDVLAMRALHRRLPILIPFERRVFALNQRLNARGVAVDRELIAASLKMIASETASLTQEAELLTGGIAPTRNAAVLSWLKTQGLALPNIQKKTVLDALTSGAVDGPAKRLLEIRLSVAMTSTKKLKVAEARSRHDARLRDLQMYHGASTGRDAGTGFQPHNLPRGTLDSSVTPEDAIGAIKTNDASWVRALAGEPMAAISSIVRGILEATSGHTMFCGDFNAIEARFTFWLARHVKGLDLFVRGVDPYRDQAADIYDVRLDAVTDAQREIGKRAVLGLGFGMGWKKFAATCAQFGTPVADELAKRAVDSYRTKHAPVVALWDNLERAAMRATKHPGCRVTVNRTTWFVERGFLYCELPSGRRLAYFGPAIKAARTSWGETKLQLHHYGVDPKSKKWVFGPTYGGRLAENCIQAIARDRMVHSQVGLDDAGYVPLISVHDELLHEKRSGDLAEFERLMSVNPNWCEGFPVKVKAWQGERYRK